MSETNFQYWRHRESGGTFAVRAEAGQVTGIFGPVADDSHPEELPRYPYDRSEAGLEWLWDHAPEFHCVE